MLSSATDPAVVVRIARARPGRRLECPGPGVAAILACLVVAIAPCAAALAAQAALSGVVELREPPQALSDATLDTLLAARVRASEVVALGETVHGSAGFLQLQARLVRYLVERHGVRLVVWESGVLRSLPMADWLEACRRGERSPPPVEIL